MLDYILLDGFQYRTPARTWRPEPVVPSTERILLDGSLDATFGPATLLIWNGEIQGRVTAESAGWGTIADLRSSLQKRELLSFTDHYGQLYTVKASGPYTERSLSPRWDAPSNSIYVKVRLTAV